MVYLNKAYIKYKSPENLETKSKKPRKVALTFALNKHDLKNKEMKPDGFLRSCLGAARYREFLLVCCTTVFEIGEISAKETTNAQFTQNAIKKPTPKTLDQAQNKKTKQNPPKTNLKLSTCLPFSCLFLTPKTKSLELLQALVISQHAEHRQDVGVVHQVPRKATKP